VFLLLLLLLLLADRNGSQGSQGEGRGEREVYEGAQVGMRAFGLLPLIATVQLHVQGKTEQAQKDLARLAKIKAEREAALAKRKAEADGVLLPPVASNFSSSSYRYHKPKQQRSKPRKRLASVETEKEYRARFVVFPVKGSTRWNYTLIDREEEQSLFDERRGGRGRVYVLHRGQRTMHPLDGS